jgi:hypothetical protein
MVKVVFQYVHFCMLSILSKCLGEINLRPIITSALLQHLFLSIFTTGKTFSPQQPDHRRPRVSRSGNF